MSQNSNFLIIKIGSIGDVIMATSMITALREEHPDCRITWMVGHASYGLLKLVPGIDEIILVDEVSLLTGSRFGQIGAVLGTWRDLIGRRFDQTFIAHGDRRYNFLAQPLRGTKRSISRDLRGGIIPGRHHSVEYARLVTGRDGPDMHDGRIPKIDLSLLSGAHPLPAQKNPYVIFAPGGAKNIMRENPARRWPVRNYVKTAEALIGQGIDVVITGAASDEWVLPEFASVPVINLIGQTTWSGLLALVDQSKCVLTHDSMMAHLPRFLTTPTVVLFGPTSPRSFFMPGGGYHFITTESKLPCQPCYDGNNLADCKTVDCMGGISTRVVLDKILSTMVESNASNLQTIPVESSID
jgi:ADP-heptose:LPS heptosyltransferase